MGSPSSGEGSYLTFDQFIQLIQSVQQDSRVLIRRAQGFQNRYYVPVHVDILTVL